MQAGVVLAPADRAAGDLAGAQRGAGAGHVGDVFGEQRADQRLAALGVAADQLVQIGQVLRGALRAAHSGVVGAQVDVLGFAVGIAGVEEAFFAGVEVELQVGEVQHGALLQFAAQCGALLGGDLRGPVGVGLGADQVKVAGGGGTGRRGGGGKGGCFRHGCPLGRCPGKEYVVRVGFYSLWLGVEIEAPGGGLSPLRGRFW
ncbi:hypothetical protein D3C72_1619720 [compost metagenome]